MNGQINSSPKDCILFDKMLCCVSKWLAEVFCYICQQFDPCIPTPCFTVGNSDHELVSSNVCLKWSHCSRIVQTKYKLMCAFWFDDCNAGATQATFVVVYEKLSVRWYGRMDLAFGSAIYESKTVLLLVSCGAFANECLTRYRFKKSQISFDEMLVRFF